MRKRAKEEKKQKDWEGGGLPIYAPPPRPKISSSEAISDATHDHPSFSFKIFPAAPLLSWASQR